ncbi:hypothetical protein CPter291_0485 [Collimonas pratensis]|uniref:Uncharacterized protein n=1 Tax=Collimonas pratensis TaxID=279113 RepID=A0ABM5Z1D3_9BURK|nr:hypothetical protein CPter291_0485 [Collimonas pratensis]
MKKGSNLENNLTGMVLEDSQDVNAVAAHTELRRRSGTG